MTFLFNKSSFLKFYRSFDFLGHERPIKDSSHVGKISPETSAIFAHTPGYHCIFSISKQCSLLFLSGWNGYPQQQLCDRTLIAHIVLLRPKYHVCPTSWFVQVFQKKTRLGLAWVRCPPWVDQLKPGLAYIAHGSSCEDVGRSGYSIPWVFTAS